MKKLHILFIFLSTYTYAQHDMHAIETVMAAFESRIEVSKNNLESIDAIIQAENDRVVWDCCVILNDIDFGSISWDKFEVISNEINLQNPELKSISGKLVDDVSKEPLLFASVALFRDTSFIMGTETDYDGNYLFTNVDPGVYDLEAHYVGYQSARLVGLKVGEQSQSMVDDVQVEDDVQGIVIDDAIVKNELTKDDILNLPIKNIGSISQNIKLLQPNQVKHANSVTVIDKETKEPLIGVHVEFLKADKFVSGAASDLEGKFSLKNLDADTYRMKISYIGYETIDTVIHGSAKLNYSFEMSQANHILPELIIVDYKVPNINSCTWTSRNVVESCSFNDCGSVVKVSTTDALEEDELAFNLDVYPNPAREFTRIKLSKNVDQLFVSNASGRLIYQKDNLNTGEHTIPLLNFTPGTYFITAVSAKEVKSEKLVVIAN